jgi:hypothetical protein
MEFSLKYTDIANGDRYPVLELYICGQAMIKMSQIK